MRSVSASTVGGTLVVLLFSLLGTMPSSAATFWVDSTQDLSDLTPGDGFCANSLGSCSLRAAVEEANYLSGSDTINVGSGTFNLGSALEVTSTMTIACAGRSSTEIRGSGLDRVFEVTGIANLTLRDARVTAGWAVGGNGGLMVVGSSADLTLQDCLLDTGLAENGGCIHTQGDLVLSHTIVSNCNASNMGGGVAVLGGTASIGDGSEIRASGAVEGGGIYQEGSTTVTVEASAITGNSVTGSGGGYFFLSTSGTGVAAQFVNVTFTGNAADLNGGAVLTYLVEPKVVYLYNCTITDNTANDNASGGGDGGGIARTGNGLVRIRNTIVAGNHDGSSGIPSFQNPDCYGTLDSDGYNLVGIVSPECTIGDSTVGNLTGTLAAPLDAMLAPATSCWGATAHPLLALSPARNSGATTGCTWPFGGYLSADQCGQVRPFGTLCDMGAVEAQDANGNHIFSDGFESANTHAWG